MFNDILNDYKEKIHKQKYRFYFCLIYKISYSLTALFR
jgi:hypothetical protein